MIINNVDDTQYNINKRLERKRSNIFKRKSNFTWFSNNGSLKVRWLKVVVGVLALFVLFKTWERHLPTFIIDNRQEDFYNSDSLEYENEIDDRIKQVKEKNLILSPALPPNMYLADLTNKRPLAKFHLTPWHVLDALSSPVFGTSCKNMNPGVEHGAKFSMVIFVKSKLANFDERNVIRETWGSVYYMKQIRIERVFVVGKTPNIEIQNHIELESMQYGDILQYKGPDSHRNFSEKITSAMLWASLNLPDDFFYASTSDDFIINFSRVLDFLEYDIQKNWRRYTAANGREASKQDIRELLPLYCVDNLNLNDVPDRNFLSNRNVPRSVYVFEYFPPYCSDGFYFMPVSMTKQLFEISRVTAYLDLDDVWVTGILRQKLLRGDNNIVKVKWPLKKPRLLWRRIFSQRENSGLTYKLTKQFWRGWKDEIENSPHCIRKHKPLDQSVVNAVKDQINIEIN